MLQLTDSVCGMKELSLIGRALNVHELYIVSLLAAHEKSLL